MTDLRERILSRTLVRGAKLPGERDLARVYGVSGATVREAIRALTSMKMVEARHGSGTYVTADAEELVAHALKSMIQLERVPVHDVLGMLGVLNAYSAELAAARADTGDIEALRQALDQIDQGTQAPDVIEGLKRFLFALAAASHHPLLESVCKFLAQVQVDWAARVAGGSFRTWSETTARLSTYRRKVVDAIEQRDASLARACALDYHQRAVQVVEALPPPTPA